MEFFLSALLRLELLHDQVLLPLVEDRNQVQDDRERGDENAHFNDGLGQHIGVHMGYALLDRFLGDGLVDQFTEDMFRGIAYLMLYTCVTKIFKICKADFRTETNKGYL